jgi:hypothetical protein
MALDAPATLAISFWSPSSVAYRGFRPFPANLAR